MGIDHALGMAGRARGVAHAGGGVLVERLPGEVAVRCGDPVLIGDRVAQARLRHMGRIGEHDVALDAGEPVGELFEQRHEGQIGEQQPVLGVIDDPDDLVGKQPRIDGVVDGADAEDAVPGLEMAPGIPGERRDAVAEADAVPLEALRHFERAAPDLGIIGGVDRALRPSAKSPAVRRGSGPHDRSRGGTAAANPASTRTFLPLRRPVHGRLAVFRAPA